MQLAIFIFGVAIGANLGVFLVYTNYFSNSGTNGIVSRSIFKRIFPLYNDILSNSKPTHRAPILLYSKPTSPTPIHSTPTSPPPILGSPFYKHECTPKYGKIALLHFTSDYKYTNRTVWNAVQSVRCYAQMRGYAVYEVIEDFGDLSNECKTFKGLLFKRHCLASQLLLRYSYVVFLDADSGVINPFHCFEEYINPNVSLHFLLRVRTGETQAGHYIAKNTSFARQFLMDWASIDHGSDQHGLRSQLRLKLLTQDEKKPCEKVKGVRLTKCIMGQLRKRSTYMGRKVQFYSRGQSFVRDAEATDFFWSHTDFLLHALKPHYDDMYGRHVDDPMFNRKLRRSDCNDHVWNIPYARQYIVDQNNMTRMWRSFEVSWLKKWKRRTALMTNISTCFPNCPSVIV